MKKPEEIRDGFTRITTILSPYTKFDSVPQDVLKKAADRGCLVHHYCELYCRNLLIEEVDEDCKHYVQAFKEWFDNYVDEVVSLEERLYCDRLLISGQFDMIVKMRGDDSLCIVDLKTPLSFSKTWSLQTAAYFYLSAGKKFVLKDGRKLIITRRLAVMIPRFEGEKCRVREFLRSDSDIDYFMKALDLYRFFNGFGKE